MQPISTATCTASVFFDVTELAFGHTCPDHALIHNSYILYEWYGPGQQIDRKLAAALQQ